MTGVYSPCHLGGWGQEDCLSREFKVAVTMVHQCPPVWITEQNAVSKKKCFFHIQLCWSLAHAIKSQGPGGKVQIVKWVTYVWTSLHFLKDTYYCLITNLRLLEACACCFCPRFFIILIEYFHQEFSYTQQHFVSFRNLQWGRSSVLLQSSSDPVRC